MRPVELEFFDHPFLCPLCKERIVYVSLQAIIVYSHRLCPSCKGELVIQQGKIITAISDRKPPTRQNVASANRSHRRTYRKAHQHASL